MTTSEDWEARARRDDALLRRVMLFCLSVCDAPVPHMPPWGQQTWTVEGRPSREQHLAARIASMIEKSRPDLGNIQPGDDPLDQT